MTKNGPLYHYCSAQTAFAILKSRTFRLSALSAANDSLEGRVLGRVFAKLVAAAGLPQGVADVVSVIVAGYADSTEGFAFCLSENGDLLSQWRAYARDGTGIAIGFDPEVLATDFGSVNFGSRFYELKKVAYGEEEIQPLISNVVEEIRKNFGEYGDFIKLQEGINPEKAQNAISDRQRDVRGLFQMESNHSPDLLSQLLKVLSPLHFRIYDTKPPSFHEEKEWRLLRYRHHGIMNEVEYFADDFSVRPFVPCLIADPARDVIKEVILGPKHRSNIEWMRAFLASAGLPNALVKQSSIESYR